MTLMQVVCSWCGTPMGTKPGPAAMISHGLCATCAAALHADLDAQDAS